MSNNTEISSSSSTSTPHLIDTLSGRTSTIYRATCKRGRLRNRPVVIKKIPRLHHQSTLACNDPAFSAALHATLCHPSIVSLISYFSTPSGFHYVLEYCPHGSLYDLVSARSPSTLVEDEVRGIARPLVEALVYLKRVRVLHRDINPSHILIGSDCRLKLSGFGSATRLPTETSTETAFCGSGNCVSPEILSGKPYSFPTDVWSLGSVLLTCLSSRPAFHAPTPDEIFDNICRARYVIPDTVSYEAQDLITGLLQKNASERTPLHRILSHPFFKPCLPVKPLSTPCSSTMSTSTFKSTSPTTGGDSRQTLKAYPSLLSANPGRSLPLPKTASSIIKLPTIAKRKPLDDITNFYQNDSQDGMELLEEPTRRLLSAPTVPDMPGSVQSRDPYRGEGDLSSRPPTPALIADSGTPTLSSVATMHEDLDQALSTAPSLRAVSAKNFLQAPRSPRLQLKRILSDPCAPSLRTVQSTGESPRTRVISKTTTSTAVSRGRLSAAPIAQDSQIKHQHGKSPRRINTRRLKPQTHKISRGQVVVLPSRSLLVDFREGERRSGRPGKEVLVVSHDGMQVEVYGAPHLSTPCCLAEPIATYSVDALPGHHMKIYEDAAQVIEQLNSRVPKLVHYDVEYRCTLMANGPPGDVEIMMPVEDDAGPSERETIRLRLQRSKRTLEISRHLAKAGARKDAGEWMKKVIPLIGCLELSEDDWLAMDGLERLAMACLGEFLRVCEVAEGTEAPNGSAEARTGRERLERALKHMEAPVEDTDVDVNSRKSSRMGSRASVMSSVVVPPRPRKFSSTAMLR
ncbi:kinase-like domain-containing protein [Daedaleopsis nitida]|nr:kinase-like domain-containing protein [Daedaleopsis nitida]